MYTATRKLEWDSAHRVLRHESKCRVLHGHRYFAEITAKCVDLDGVDRVIDFGVLKQIIGGWIDEYWDHNTLVNSEDEELLSFCMQQAKDHGHKTPFSFDGEPTAEKMAEFLFGLCQKLLKDYPIEVSKVRLYETPNCWSEFPA